MMLRYLAVIRAGAGLSRQNVVNYVGLASDCMPPRCTKIRVILLP